MSVHSSERKREGNRKRKHRDWDVREMIEKEKRKRNAEYGHVKGRE